MIQCAALKYPVSESEQGLTLVLTHGLSSHKESYHPTVANLLRSNAAGICPNWIREIWSIDMPNHGETAVLNRAYLEDRQERGRKEDTIDFSTYLNAFLSIPQLQGHRVVGIAHSGSCAPWTHALTHPDRTHPHPFALIFIEPVFMFPGMPPTDPRAIHGAANVRGVLAKQDTWSDRAEAKRCKGGKTVWSKWDDLALDLFEVLEPASSPRESTKSSSYVRSILRKEEESPLYACLQHTVEPSQLTRMCVALTPSSRRGPDGGHDGVGGLHIIWAEVEEFISKSAKAEILDAMSHRVLSQRIVSGSGHLIPQENPSGLAHALRDVLAGHIAVAAGLTVRAPL
ncbi:hypothetical protein F5141DRAFT_1009268 [Pisolithus sp. B1]|nr:hypothetical protein F5141DRAFT_1009268 [Pisolithus sp. B1]